MSDFSSASETSLPDLGLSPYDDILNDLIYSNARLKEPSEFSQLQENKVRLSGDTDSEGRSALTGKRTFSANTTTFEAYNSENRTKSSCNVNKKSDIRKVKSCSNLNKCRCRETRPQRSFTDLRQNCGQNGCQHRCQDDGRSPGAGKCPTMSYKALSHTYWYVINNKQLERNRFQMWDSKFLQDELLMYRHIIHYMEILACTSRGDSGWYIADMQRRRAENVRRLKRYYMSYREVCRLLDSGSTNKQDRQPCYVGGRCSFPRRMRRQGSPKGDHEKKDKIVTVECNYPLSTVDRLTSDQYVSSSKVDRLTSDQYVSSSKVKPGARSIDTKSRRHQHDEHSLPVGADARINQPDAWMLVKGADSRRHNPDTRELVKGADSSTSSVKQRDLKPHSNVNEHKTEDRRRRLPSNTTRESVSKHSLINQEAKGQRDSKLKGDPSSSIHQDQSSSGQKAHPDEKDSGKRHHEPPTESHQKFRSRTNVYTQDSKSHKISRTCYHEQAAENQWAQLQDRDYHREREPLFGDRRRRSKSRSRWMDDRDTERHCTQRQVRDDNTERRPWSHESRQKSQDHEDGRFTCKTQNSESKTRRENSRELDRKRAPKGRLETPGDLQVGKASEESKTNLDNRKQEQSTVEVHEGEDPCTTSSTELRQTGSEAESFSSSDHSCNLLQEVSASRPNAKASEKEKSHKSMFRQSVSSTLALLKQAEVDFDEKLDQLSFPGAAGGVSGEHKSHTPHVGLSCQPGQHILQPFNLRVRDSDGPNQKPSSSDKAVGDFDALNQNMAFSDYDRIYYDGQRHNLTPPNQNGRFFYMQNQHRHWRPYVTTDKSQMRWEGMYVCSSSNSLRDPNKGLGMDVKQGYVNSLGFSGCSTSSMGRDSVSNRKHYLSHDFSPTEPVIKRQKTLSTDEVNLARFQRFANSGVTASNKNMQPIFHSVELGPIDGEHLLMSASLLAHSVSEERALYNYNIGEVRYAKPMRYRYLLPCKTADNACACTDDMTFQVVHSRPRYFESSD
ncbi:hypothetical protein BsWGS_15253 [Bradybaena similaris]